MSKLENRSSPTWLWPEDLSIQDTLKRVRRGSPLWWDTDYAKDPREFVSFGTFEDRLVHIGRATTYGSYYYDQPYEHEVYLYPYSQVPISILDLTVEGMPLQFLVTARPYHEKDLFPFYFRNFNDLRNPQVPEVGQVRQFLDEGGKLRLPNHFYPHIRGLFAGRRENHFFWYTLGWNATNFDERIASALKENNLSYLYTYNPPYRPSRTYSGVWEELEEKRGLVDMKRPYWHDFGEDITEVSVYEFLDQYSKEDSDLLLYYPIRLPNIEETLPLVITTRTHQTSRVKKPVVLGIYAENGLAGFARRAGILRIKDRNTAEAITRGISQDFGISVDTVLFTPQKGRPNYQRVSLS